MKKSLLIFLFVQFSFYGFSQEDKVLDSVFSVKDSTIYAKSIDYAAKREFKANIKEKYSDKDFIYTEEEKQEQKPNYENLSFLRAFAQFIGNIFPFLLGGFIVFVIIKLVLGKEFNFWNLNKNKKKATKTLIYEEEDIHEIDLESLIKQAIADTNYRLAIRYYYLATLKVLSNNKLIEYHKEKTNSDYKFELEDLSIREEFSYLSYVFTYVWYGEFPIDVLNFKSTQQKFQSFKNKINK